MKNIESVRSLPGASASRYQTSALATVVALLLFVGAGCSSEKTRRCTTGQVVACPCVNGQIGTQTCTAAGRFSPCQCLVPADAAGYEVPNVGAGGIGGAGQGAGGMAAGGSAAGGARAVDARVDTPENGGGNFGSGGQAGSGGLSLDANGSSVRGGAAGYGAGGVAQAGRVGTGGAAGTAVNGGNVGSGGASLDAGAVGVDASLSPSTEIASGTGTLVDVFVGDAGTYVITAGGAYLYPRGPASSPTVALSATPISTAAFDGAHLVIADNANFQTFSLDLRAAGGGSLIESCGSSVLVSGNRFVCGGATDTNRVFNTYDAISGEQLATSQKYTYNGIPMRRIPGTDDFVTVDVELSPPDFHLYSVEAAGAAVFIADSPYHGDFPVGEIYGFDGSPPTHLITPEGLRLKIYAAGCLTKLDASVSSCFVKDGTMATLGGSQIFVGLDFAAPNKLAALVDPVNGTSEPPCSHGCLLENTNLAGTTLLSQRILHLTMKKLIAFRHDPVANAAVIAFTAALSTDGGTTTGFRVLSVPY